MNLFQWAACAAVAAAMFVATTNAQSPAATPQPAAASDVNALHVQGAVSVLIDPVGVSGPNANVTVQTSDDAIVLVDTGAGTANDRYLAAIRRISPKPVRFIINTQAAGDHTGGNEALAKTGRPFGGRAAGAGFLLPDQTSGATIIAHEKVLQILSGGAGRPAVPFAAWPSETYFAPEHELYNGESIQMFHVNAVTEGETLVFFRRSDVISTGDVFSTLSYPKLDQRAGGSIDGEIAALNQIIDLAIPREKQEGGTFIIPGHGRVSDEADVVEYRDMLVIIRHRVQDMKSKGRSVADVKAAKPSFDYDRRYATPQWTADQFVEAVFATLK